MKAIQKSRTPSEYFRITPLSLHQNILRYELANGLTQSKDVGSFDPEHFTEESEMNLIKNIGELEEKVEQATLRRKPHIITNYAHNFINTFNTFYNDVKILDSRERIITAEPRQRISNNG